MPLTVTLNFTCDVCGRTQSVDANGRQGRAPDGWIATYGVNMKRPQDARYVCEIHNVEVHKTEADDKAVMVLRDSKDVVKDVVPK